MNVVSFDVHMKFKKVRIFTNFPLVNTTMFLGRHIDEFTAQNIEIVFNKSGKADLVLVINAATSPRWAVVPNGRVIKVLQEPIISRSFRYLFTYHHSRIYDQVLTHSPVLDDPRQIKSVPLMGSFVDPTEVELDQIYKKQNNLSIIASTRASLPGHKLRLQFINKLLDHFPELDSHTFGRGRTRELSRKVDGLLDYRYSIAIENSRSASYVTEKFYDCILAGSVPLYYGAPNIADYFPVDSYIELPIEHVKDCFDIISGLTEDEYNRRIPSLIEARALIRDHYSIGALITNRVDEFRNSPNPKRKFVFLLRLDGLICLVQKIGITNFLYKLVHLRRT